MSIAAPMLKTELHLNNEALGHLFSAFLYTYAIGQILVGYFLDRWPVRWLYGACVGLWSLAGMLSGLAHNFWQMFACRALLGTFEAANWPAAARIVTRITLRRERAFANGIFNSGTSVGALLAPLILIWLFNAVGWRWGFAIVGSLGFIWLWFWIAWTRNGMGEPPAELSGTETLSADANQITPWSAILRRPLFYAVLLSSVFGNAIFYFSVNWIPTFMMQSHHLKFNMELSILLTIVYIGLDIGYMGGGALVMPLVKKGWSTLRARLAIMSVSALLMSTAACIPWVTNVWLVALLLCLLNIGRGGWGSNFFTFTQEISPDKIALLTGIAGCAGALGGAVFTNYVGKVSNTGDFTTPFVILGFLPIIATLPLLWVSVGKSSKPENPAMA